MIKFKVFFSSFLIAFSILGCKTEVEKQENLLAGKDYKIWNSFKWGLKTHDTPQFCYTFYKDHRFEFRSYNEKGKAQIEYSDANVGIEDSFKWKIVEDSIVISSSIAKDYREAWFIKKISGDTLTIVEKEGWLLKFIASHKKDFVL